MKRKLTKALALLLMLCMLLPQTALAATTYYLQVNITGPDGSGLPQSLDAESNSKLNDLNTPLAADVVEIVSRKFDDGSLEAKFDETDLGVIVLDGVEAFEDGTWDSYVSTHYDDVDNAAFKDILKSKTSKFGDLIPNVANKIKYTDHLSREYTVTITLKEHTTGGGGAGGGGGAAKDTHDIKLPAASSVSNGSIKASHEERQEGEKVTITLTPDAGYRTNQVKVVDASGKAITLTAIDNNTYTFIMPAGDVTVSATFILDTASPEKTGISNYLVTGTNVAYMQGKADGLFHPTASVTRGQVAAIFYRLLKEQHVENVAYTKTFADVPDGFWCADAVNTLAALGIVNGVTDTTFNPNAPITRAQFVAICARMAGTLAEGEAFHDVSESYWAHDYIQTASAYGWVTGYGNGMFGPTDQITRAQTAVIINRILARVPDRAAIDASGIVHYPDVPATYWAFHDIWEVSEGAITRPDSN